VESTPEETVPETEPEGEGEKTEQPETSEPLQTEEGGQGAEPTPREDGMIEYCYCVLEVLSIVCLSGFFSLVL
jgi:hypothetical protein